jgi:hypothetical protein
MLLPHITGMPDEANLPRGQAIEINGEFEVKS